MNTMEQKNMQQDTEKNDVVEMLMKLLQQQNMKAQAQDFREVFQCVAGMQMQLGAMASELQGVRRQLQDLQAQQPKEETKQCIKEVSRLQENIKGLAGRIASVKDRLIKTASNALDTFKQKGKSAMCKVLQKGISAEKSVLAGFRSQLAEAMTDCGRTADRIDGIGNELKQVGNSFANVGRLLSGREAKEMSREDPGIAFTRAINKPIRKIMADLGKNIDRIDRASEKLDGLSDRLRGGKEDEKETKQSVKEKLSEMQSKVDEQKKESEPNKEKEKDKEDKKTQSR